MTLTVAMAVHGRFHAFDLARGLHARGLLDQVATTYPAVVARRFLPAPVRLRCAPWLEAWRRGHGKVPLVPDPDPGLARAFGRFAARTLPEGSSLLVAWSSAAKEVIPVAQARGMRVVLERGSTHISHQARVLEEEYARFGVAVRPVHPAIVERELWEYDHADAVAVPTRFAAETFVAHGVPPEKLLVNAYGVDAGRFHPRPSRTRAKPRILFVGRVGLRKGIPWLLRAFAPLRRRAELHLVGPVEPAMKEVLAAEPLEGVVLRGALPRSRIAELYREADIFCLPSLEEGFALVLLEAMASGLPVVTTDAAGGAELAADGRAGMLVPSRDAAALTDALDRLVEDRERREEMGARARRRIEQGFTWEHSADRAVAHYRRILARPAGP